MTAPIETFIVESHEPWQTYTLTNGVRLRIKAVVTAIHLLPDTFDDQGKPVLQVNGGLAVVIESWPKDLGPCLQ